jgi:hypothetical protein
MFMATTADCKKFLVKLFSENPSLITDAFFDSESLEVKTAIEDSKTLKLWRQESRDKVRSNYSYSAEDELIEVSFDGIKYYGIEKKDLMWERVFVLNPNTYGDTLSWLVLEDIYEGLYLGVYIGN